MDSPNDKSSQHPPFIIRGASAISTPPYMQKDSHMYGFFVKGQLQKIQVLVDRQLNSVAQGQYRFKALSDYMLLSFTNINKAYSLTTQGRAKGWGSEIDTAIWIPIGAMVNKNGKQCLDQVFWFIPYMWVDNPIASIVGRELYGYPKNIGRFELPAAGTDDHFGLTVNGYKTYSSETQIQWLELLTIKNLRPTAAHAPYKQWQNFVDAIGGIWDTVSSMQLCHQDWQLSTGALKELLKPQLPQIFLKQTPDGNGLHAVYQALMSSPAKIVDFHAGGLLDGQYEVTLNDIASEPIAQDLGLSIGKQTAAFGFWLNFDFILDKAQVLVDNSHVKPEKIAVLGGGISSLTAVFALTSQPGWQNRYDITLYQQGWRLGGKGASGRNAALGERIEEHGLHIWFGFYRNAFDIIQQVYNELDRPEGAALRSWEEAFKPHNFIVLTELINEQWVSWPLDFPFKEGDPGKGPASLSIWKLAQTLYAFIKQWLGNIRTEVKSIESKQKIAKKAQPRSFAQRLEELSDWIEDEIEDTVDDIERVIKGVVNFVDSLPENIQEHRREDQSWLKKILEEIKEWLDEEVCEFLEENDTIRRLFIGIDLSITVLVGMIDDDIFTEGFDVINHLDFRQWLLNHGANEKFTVNSSAVRALYDLVFGYENGDIHTPNVEAGTLLRGALRLGICYTGAVMWKMQAGMGDAMFTPFYEVLKKRGVKFKYFHEVDTLTLDPDDPRQVQSIKITRQVDLTHGLDSYQPLVEVKGLGCWPNQPLYEQIVPEQAKLLTNHHIDLENFWNRWPQIYQQHYGRTLPQTVLEKGKDFDTVIFGIPIASLPFLCPELLQQSPALSAAHDNVKTTATQAYQLWTGPDLQQLGWTELSSTGEEPVLGAWTEPVDTWAAMNQLLDKEDWGNLGVAPKNVAYFCGVQPITDIPARTEYDFPIKCTTQVKQAAIDQLNHDIYSLWPKAATAQAFDWQVLTDVESRSGELRFDSQYWRSNVSPSERYVLSVIGSTQYRIDTKLDDFDNIYFTGDWIKNGLNAGCVEGATMSGLQTARAMCGYPAVIKGEFDFGDPDL